MALQNSDNGQFVPGVGHDAEMFELAPVSLWLEDYSALKALFEQWRRGRH